MNPSACRERILSEDYMDIIITENRMGKLSEIPEEELCRRDLGIIYECVHIPLPHNLRETFNNYAYSVTPACFGLIDSENMNAAGIINVQNHPTLDLMGENVLIGIIDTGIDYANSIFRNLDGSTRIKAIWDQTIQSERPPAGLAYGTEYAREIIDDALAAEDPFRIVPSRDENGHGTYVASLAAGSANVENNFIGAAPESTIAVVKVKPAKQYLRDYFMINPETPCFQENDIMSGLKYLNEMADREGIPLVVCLAMGTSTGSHTGSSPLSGLLETYANFSNRVMVVGGGNEAGERHHFSGQFTNVVETKDVQIVVEEGVQGFIAELWTEIPNIMAVSIKSPSGEIVPVGSVRDRDSVEYDFVFDRTRLTLNYYLLVEKTSSELIHMRFENPIAGIWTITVQARNIADGVFNIWMPMTEFLSGNAYFTNSNPDITLTEPGNTYSPITVSYYDGVTNGIVQSSGRGYTRINVIKPDFTAPGMNVLGAGLGNQYIRKTGSCASIAITAGAAALILQWAIYIAGETDVDSLKIKNYLILGAQQDPAFTYPNKHWGYGRLDLYNTFLRLREY